MLKASAAALVTELHPDTNQPLCKRCRKPYDPDHESLADLRKMLGGADVGVCSKACLGIEEDPVAIEDALREEPRSTIALVPDAGDGVDALLARLIMVEDEIERVNNLLRPERQKIIAEIERIIKDNGGRAIAHPDFEKIEIVDDFAPYAYDTKTLRAAQELLPDDERAKVLKHLPETTIVVPEKWEPGNPRSITALIGKYGAQSDVGVLLSIGMTRARTGSHLSIKRKKPEAAL